MSVSGNEKYDCTDLNGSLTYIPEYVFHPIRLAVNFTLADDILDTEGM